MCALGNFGARFARAVFQILRSQINPPTTDPKLDTLCRKNLLRTPKPVVAKICHEPKMIPECAIFRDRLGNRPRVSKSRFSRLAPPLPPSSSQLRATDQQQRREKFGKNVSLLKLARFFFAHSPFLKSAALGNRPSQSFISSLAPEKNVTYFLKRAERCELLRFQR